MYTRLDPVPIPPVAEYSKHKVLQSASPPQLSVAKQTLGSPSKSVRESIVNICLCPSRLVRSRGTASNVPDIPFPAESQAYRRRLERLEADNVAAPEMAQDVPPPEDVPRS